jgi:hypothetical protein
MGGGKEAKRQEKEGGKYTSGEMKRRRKVKSERKRVY